MWGGEALTPNNRMELTGAIKALEALKRDSQVSLTTDSQYVLQGITQWIEKWKAQGWKTSNRQPVKNQDLWQELDLLVQDYDITWHWVKRYSGHPENELVDEPANRGIDELEPS